MMRSRCVRLAAVGIVAGGLAACASGPVVAPAARPAQTFDEKMGWILRLEEDRMLESPAPPAPPPPPPASARGRRAPVTMPSPPPRPDLVALLKDEDPRIRRRAALAVGRTRLATGVPPLLPLLSGDADHEVRQMAAFALGLIGDASAADALTAALKDTDPIVQGRAAEALGLIAHKPAATAIADMMTVHARTGALADISPDDLEFPKSPPVEALRLGMYALARLGAYEPLAAALSDGAGQPISRWWPIAYAFRRVGDPNAGAVLLTLLQGQGGITRAFAARGLGVAKERRGIEPLIATVTNQSEVTNVRIEAARALAELGASEAVDGLLAVVKAPTVDANLRLEAVTALGQLRPAPAVDLFVDLLTDAWPSMRSAALTGLARTDPDAFLIALSGLDPDPHWSVRAALATALGTLGAESGHARLGLMLEDADQRVLPAVLAAIVAAGAPDAEATLLSRLAAEDTAVRLAAIDGLTRLKSRQAVTHLTEAYEQADKDPTYVVRGGILAALVELDRAAARPLVERALGDRDWAVRVRAATLLRTIDPGADVSAIRPAPAAVVPELNDLAPMIRPTVSPAAYIDTDKGLIQIELAVLDAPRTVANFMALARRNFFGGTPFHRLVPNFVAQDGDSRGDGRGGPGYSIRDELNQRPYLRGTVGMALSWEDTGGSQFFITHSPQPHLDARYTVFGQVVAGMDVVDRLTQWDQIRTVRIWDGINWIGGR